jgi:glyoxylase-like metal-dependent hydrolase (beta-lactamase superfamily II)
MVALAVLATRAQAPQTPAAPDLKTVLHEAQDALGMLRGAQEEDSITTVYYQGSGAMYAFGQAFRPDMPWPAFKVTSYVADISFMPLGMRVQLERTNPDGPVQGGGGLPLAAPQRQLLVVADGAWAGPGGSGGPFAWNEQGVGTGGAPAQAAARDRYIELLMLPHAALKAARAAGDQTRVSVQNGATVLTYPAAGATFNLRLNAEHRVDRVETRIDNPILGDTLVEAEYSDYLDLGGELHPSDVLYPGHIVRRMGGHPVLDLRITEGNSYNPYVVMPVPANVLKAGHMPEPVKVDAQEVTEGIWYLTGGSHHSVAVEFSDYVALIEAPQSDERAMAVIDSVRKAIPSKPIRYVVNTHHHFDHAGGLRAAAVENLTLVVQAQARPYFERVLASPRTLNPAFLSKAPRKPRVEGVDERRVIRDGTRTLELHRIQGSNHADTMLVAYLPNERILVEADIYTPPAAGAPAPKVINPESVNLYNNIERLNLNVERILPIHGRMVSINDLRAFIGKN